MLTKQNRPKTYSHQDDHIPLKHLVKCQKCGHFLSAYKAKKNQQYYYKCSTQGCCCNKRADSLHLMFKAFLDDNVQNTLNKDIFGEGRESLSSLWSKSDLTIKMEIQCFVLPTGIYYDRQKDMLLNDR